MVISYKNKPHKTFGIARPVKFVSKNAQQNRFLSFSSAMHSQITGIDLDEYFFRMFIDYKLDPSVDSIIERWKSTVKPKSSFPEDINITISKIMPVEIEVSDDILVNKLVREFVKIVSAINIVKKIFLNEDKNIVMIWTIIDAPPFEDILCDPIYEAELKMLRMLKGSISVDFRLYNINEFHKDISLEQIIPSDAKLVWEA